MDKSKNSTLTSWTDEELLRMAINMIASTPKNTTLVTPMKSIIKLVQDNERVKYGKIES